MALLALSEAKKALSDFNVHVRGQIDGTDWDEIKVLIIILSTLSQYIAAPEVMEEFPPWYYFYLVVNPFFLLIANNNTSLRRIYINKSE